MGDLTPDQESESKEMAQHVRARCADLAKMAANVDRHEFCRALLPVFPFLTEPLIDQMIRLGENKAAATDAEFLSLAVDFYRLKNQGTP